MSAVYPHFKGSLLIGEPNTLLITSVVRAVLLSAAYVFDPSHKYLIDIPVAARVAVSDPLTGPTVNVSSLGGFDTDDPTLLAVTGPRVVAAALFIDVGADGTSRLVIFQDTGLTGIPFTPTGVNHTLIVNAAGWFVL